MRRELTLHSALYTTVVLMVTLTVSLLEWI